jgi:hypothetical protein
MGVVLFVKQFFVGLENGRVVDYLLGVIVGGFAHVVVVGLVHVQAGFDGLRFLFLFI